MNPYAALVGRASLQGLVLNEFRGDIQSANSPLGVGWALGKVTAGTLGIWTPLFRAQVVGTAVIKTASVAGRIAGPPAIGYALGAVAGTAIAEAAFGEGEMAYDLYTNPDVLSEGGILYETADILGNAKKIFDHYNEAGYFSGPAGGRGNPAVPTYQESGHVTLYRQMYGV